MSSTDDRIVRMQFDNKQFMKGAADSQKALADTNKAVDSAGKSKGLLDLSSQMGTVSVTASKMAVITTTALATIANKVTNIGLNMAKSLTFDPIKQGFSEYESMLTKQNVIQNATGKSAKEVKGILNQLNRYSDQTIYSFGNMTDAITKFTNAGVPLKQSVTSIKGIANAAAFAGASSEEANRAMYAFSQSMSLGFIQLQDWNQIENANMGTVQFKQALIDAGVAAGTLTKKGKEYITAAGHSITATKGWRDGLQDQWATTKVLNTALGKYADNSTKLGKKAFDSATKVRTFTAFMDTLKESLGSGWSGIFTALFGNLKQSTTMWTGLSNSVGGVVQGFFKFISTALKTWRAMGGFQKLLGGFSNILAPIKALLHAIGDAWHAAFPSSNKGAGKALYGLSAGFELITRPLTWLAKGIPVITPLLTGLFMAIKVGGSAIGNVIGYIVDFVKAAMGLVEIKAPNAGGFLGFIQSIVIVVRAAVDEIGALIAKGKSLGSTLSGAVSGIHLPSFSMPDLSGVSSGASGAASAASSAASGIQSASSKLMGVAAKMGEIFSGLWDKIKSFIQNISPEDVVKSFNQAIFATMAYEVIRFTHTLRKGFSSLLDIGPSFVNFIDDLGGSLSGFAQAAKREAMAKMIISVGIALGILAVSLWVLSKIPAQKLLQALGAMGALAFILNKSMGAFGDVVEKLDKKGTIGKSLALSVAMLALAGSMIMLATAMLIMNKVNWSSLFKGVATMFVMMKLLEKLGNLGDKAAKNLIAGAAAIAAVSVSMIILAGALLLFKLVDWESMGKAGAALAAVTLAVGALALIPYEGIAKVGLALLAASVGMVALANALIMFKLVDWESMGKAAVMLTVLALAVAGILIASGGGAGAAVILATAAAMVGLALACIMFNHVDWESIGKAAVVLTLLTVAVAGLAAILTVFLYAIAPVSPVLIILAAGFALMGVGLLAFAAAMTLAVALAGAGVAAFAVLATGAAVAVGVFFQTLAQQAPVMRESILKILQEIINTIVESVPMIIQGFKDLWAAIKKELQGDDKKKSIGDIVDGWLQKIDQKVRKYIPKLTQLGVDIVLAFLQGLISRTGEFTTLGIQFLTKLISGIGSKMGKLTDTATDVIIKFINGLEKNADKMSKAGINLITTFLHDLASNIRNGSSAIGGGIADVLSAMSEVGLHMVQGLGKGISDNMGEVLGPIGDVVNQAIALARHIPLIKSPSRVFMEIGKFMVMGLGKGIQDHAALAITSVASMMHGTIAMADDMMNRYIQKLDQKAIAARGRAQGLAAAAARAQKSANKTKTKTDDKAANNLSKRAKEAAKAARKEEEKAKQERQAQAAKARWERADSAQRAEIRSNQAKSQLAGAKQAEKDAEAARVQANALREQAKHAGSAAERKALQKAAQVAMAEARKQAKKANDLVQAARNNSVDALKYQKLAGDEAAKAFQEQFDSEAKAAADAKEFDKLTDAEKADKRRQEAADLQSKAEKDLARAKELALTDLDKANALAQQAMDEAEQARQLMDEAAGYANQGATGTETAQVVNLYQSDAAAAAYNNYSDMYDAAVAAAAASPSIEFNQYNTSPESLSDAEIYRQTNNQLTFATDKLAGAAA